MKHTILSLAAGCLIGLFITLHGCGLLNKTDKRTEQSKSSSDHLEQSKTTMEDDSSGKSLQMAFEKDDVQSAYAVQLWPKGVFKFSAENGFEGEAERIVISGQLKEQRNRTKLAANEQQHKGKQETVEEKITQKKNTSTQETRETKFDFRWAILGILFLIISCILVYRKFFIK